MARPSRRPQIRAAIVRRLDANEPIDVRSIIREAGGSASTVTEVLSSVKAEREGAAVTPQEGLAAPSTVEKAVREAVEAVMADLTREVKGATAYSMDKIEYGYRRLMEIAEGIKQVSVSAYPAGQSPAPGGSGAPDTTLLEARNRSLVTENARLSRQVEWLVAQLYEVGVEVDMEQLKRAGR